MTKHIKNVALVGASGNLGSSVLENLVKQGKHNITVITRPESSATFPESVNVQRGVYKDAKFLEKAFAGNDIVMLMLSFAAVAEEGLFFDAAAKAGVKYVIPSEWGAPIIEGHTEDSPILEMKIANHRRIEAMGMKWISVATNTWLDYCFIHGLWDIDVHGRSATIYTDSGTFNTTTIAYIGASTAKFLALPKPTIDKEYANNTLFLSSFQLTQPQIFECVLRTTGTQESDWEIERKSIQSRIDRGRKRMAEGDQAGVFDLIIGSTIEKGDYSSYINSQSLNVPQENLDEVIKEALKKAVPGGWTSGDALNLKK